MNMKFFRLGNAGIRLCFPDGSFANEAAEHLFLYDHFQGDIVATLNYVPDESVARDFPTNGRPNVVGIARQENGPDDHRLILQMFDAFTVVLDFNRDSIHIRYPSQAPHRLLLDDVLQAALQPVLDRLRGFILHGACMARNGEAIVFMGDSGSGKSTSAFNLTRYGFNCYADDAVLVTPFDGELTVWPLSREFSIRPMSFKLFEKQGIRIGPYIQDGQKYYFSQTAGELPGAKLKYITFVEISGTAQTVIFKLDRAQIHEKLSQTTRHFSFMGRSRADHYARILSENTPGAMTASVGTDLDYQARLFESLFTDPEIPYEPKQQAIAPDASRREKMSIIREEWIETSNVGLREIIPMLGDFDPVVFKLVLGFFQNLAVGKLTAIHSPNDRPLSSTTAQVPWMHTNAWMQGCNRLIRETAPEVLQRFVHAWIISAPIIYPFLKKAVESDHGLLQTVELAWARFLEKRNDQPPQRNRTAHLTFTHKSSESLASSSMHHRVPDKPVPDDIQHLYGWIDTATPMDRRVLTDTLARHFPHQRITLVTIWDQNQQWENIVAIYDHLIQNGRQVNLSRHLPLCDLAPAIAERILGSNGFDDRIIDQRDMLWIKIRSLGENEIISVSRQQDHIQLNAPYKRCCSCTEHLLGFCRGAFMAA